MACASVISCQVLHAPSWLWSSESVVLRGRSKGLIEQDFDVCPAILGVGGQTSRIAVTTSPGL